MNTEKIELREGEDVFCFQCDSMDDFIAVIGARQDELFSHYRLTCKIGTAYFAGERYSYRIWGDQNHCSNSLHDNAGDKFCPTRHMFMPPVICELMADCEMCCELVTVVS